MAHQMSDGLSGHRGGAPLPAGSALVVILLGVAGSAWLISAADRPALPAGNRGCR
jgi:hypothetical protein